MSNFLNLSVQDRISAVKQKQLCINCLRSGHYAKECKSTKCRKCSKTYNTLLHIEGRKSSTKESQDKTPKRLEETEAVVMHCVQDRALINQTMIASKKDHSSRGSNSHIILATAQVNIRDNQGRRHTGRVLLDPDSQAHFITEDMVRRLQLPCQKESSAINGIMRNLTNIDRSTKVQIESQNTAFKADLECLIIPIITATN